MGLNKREKTILTICSIIGIVLCTCICFMLTSEWTRGELFLILKGVLLCFSMGFGYSLGFGIGIIIILVLDKEK